MISARCIKVGMGMAAAGMIGSAAYAGPIPTRAQLNSLLGTNLVLEDFETFAIGFGSATGLDVSSLDSTTIANGQGPGLVQPGARYSDPTALGLQWNGDQYYGLNTKTILSNGANGSIEIAYSPPVVAMGVDLRGFQGYGWNGAVDFYDTSSTLLGTTPATIVNGGPENVFVGWLHAAGISKVIIHSATFSWSPLIDNHGYGRAFVIQIAGACPGVVNIGWGGASPGVNLALMFSFGTGNFVVPGGPCAGTVTGLSAAGIRLVRIVPSGPLGQGTTSGAVPAAACGRFVQMLDLATCDTSNVGQLP